MPGENIELLQLNVKSKSHTTTSALSNHRNHKSLSVVMTNLIFRNIQKK
ncbi:hypothetical protein SAMN05444483_1147 [Salegentibacter echinorum]|uniref:Uncharacterized protein n=1 Tax=Salegentibacter echinorum TaxID=1073325 RepID=A0A1M5KBY7_SALEC|nr:hypothetical protein SAMN05444483_1147 [Salegentibacter echinorum]